MSAVWRLAIGALIVLVAASMISAVAASNTVPGTNMDAQSSAISVQDLAPAACAGLGLTAIVTGGPGLINGGVGNTLILGSSGNDTIRAKNGNDCILAGGGNDDIDGFPGTDVCYGGPGVDIFNRCETIFDP